MLTGLYVEALIADEKAADQVWHHWDAGVVSDNQAACAEETILPSHQPEADLSPMLGAYLEISLRNGMGPIQRGWEGQISFLE